MDLREVPVVEGGRIVRVDTWSVSRGGGGLGTARSAPRLRPSGSTHYRYDAAGNVVEVEGQGFVHFGYGCW